MAIVKKYSGEDVATAANVALKKRLYVSGWLLSSELKNARQEPEQFDLCLAYDNDDVVGVSIQKKVSGFTQVFVRKAKRRNGIGRLLVEPLKTEKAYGVKGIRTTIWSENGFDVG